MQKINTHRNRKNIKKTIANKTSNSSKENKNNKKKNKQREITSTDYTTTPKGIHGQPRTPYTPTYR